MPSYSRNPVIGAAPCKVCGRTDEWRMDKTGSAYLTCPSVNGGCGSRVTLGIEPTMKMMASFDNPSTDDNQQPEEQELGRGEREQRRSERNPFSYFFD